MKMNNKKKKFGRFIKKSEGNLEASNTKTVSKKRKVAKVIGITFLVLILLMVIYVAITIIRAPKIDPENIYQVLSESTAIYDDKDNPIETVYGKENRDNIKLSDTSKDLQNAIISIEDKTFWRHHGFNFIRMAGAVKDSVFSRKRVAGTSTITQQLARNAYLKKTQFDYSVKRKIIEAYYAFKLERKLSKEEILEAYLNTVYFGFGVNGVENASLSYFSKPPKKLSIAQCAALAALPQSPDRFELVKFIPGGNPEEYKSVLLKETDEGVYIANDLSKDRREYCLKKMKEEGYITNKQYKEAKATPLKKILNPNYAMHEEKNSYFTDYLIEEVVTDLQKKKNMNREDAVKLVYSGGLKIYSTLDSEAQSVIENVFESDYGFPALAPEHDLNGNILTKNGAIALYKFSNIFDENGVFTFAPGEASSDKDGNLTIKKGNRLNIYKTNVNGKTDYSLEFKGLYKYDDHNRLYSIGGGFINIPANFKKMDSEGDLVLSSKFFKKKEYSNFITKNEDGEWTINPEAYELKKKARQPQAAMTIVENSTGYIKAMQGGRGQKGRLLYNRAVKPRQPGSSIKPLGVYSAALQQSANEAVAGKKHNFQDFNIDKQGAKYWGDYFTTASVVVDEKTKINGKFWPKNESGTNAGPMTVQNALAQSINTCAVKILMQVGVDFSEKLLERFGISTLETEGAVTDKNIAALALGGMVNGVTTLDMASAYTVFPNNGTRIEPKSYRKILDKDGKLLLKSKKVEHKVLDPGVAWIMTDLLKGVVSSVATGANVIGVRAGGKTGTTDDNFDMWFDGITPKYSASLWVGNDQNFSMTGSSLEVANLWGRIMSQISKARVGTYKKRPANVIYYAGKYFISGTEKNVPNIKDASYLLMVKLKICTESGLLATPWCNDVEEQEFKKSEAPTEKCDIHTEDANNPEEGENEGEEEE